MHMELTATPSNVLILFRDFFIDWLIDWFLFYYVVILYGVVSMPCLAVLSGALYSAKYDFWYYGHEVEDHWP